MDECENQPRRKKIKSSCGCANPLFEQWLTELRNEAASKQWKTQYVYDKALKSLRKYPLPLKSGKEARILEFFGEKICSMLDDKLAKHFADTANADSNEMDEVSSRNSRSGILSAVHDIDTTQKTTDNASNGRGISKKEYIPARKSGSYALIITLYKFSLMDGFVGYMRKMELMIAAQPLSEKSFTVPEPGSHYTAWSSMGSLIKKGLVKKEGNPARYSLSSSGLELAEKILQGEEKLMSSATNSQSSTLSFQSGSLTQNTYNSESSSQQSSVCSVELIAAQKFTLEPGQFDIILCVDSCETVSGPTNERKHAVQKELKKNGVHFDVRKLNVGDFLWVAREKVAPIPGCLHLPSAKELVLDYVIERKRKDDLAGSIKDGRFKEQKFRLKNCGLRHPIYLVEDCRGHFCIPDFSLLQAISNTQLVDGFTIKHTKDQAETVAYLTIMTRYLQSYYSNKKLRSCTLGEIDQTEGLLSQERNCVELLTFEEFNMNSIKNKSLTVAELFVKQLLKLHGLSVDKAKAITDLYPTPSSLLKEYDLCENEKDKENLLSSIKFGKSGRSLGPAVSRVLYMLYNRDILV